MRQRIFKIPSKSEAEWRKDFSSFWIITIGKKYDPDEKLSRREMAQILDHYLQPFTKFPIKMDGNE